MRIFLKHPQTLRRPLALLFLLGVLLPSVALSVLALRAASREALFVERRLEVALLAEVGAAARQVERALDEMGEELSQELRDLPLTPQGLARWGSHQELAAVPFLLSQGVLSLPGGSAAEKKAFLQDFGPFLRGEGALPVYDRAADVYRRRVPLPEPPHPPEAVSSVVEMGIAPPLPEALYAFPQEGGADAPRAPREDEASSWIPLAALRERAFVSPEDSSDQSEPSPGFVAGVRSLVRNVVPQARPKDRDKAPAGVPSAFVARHSTLATLRRQGSSGFIPRLSDGGLALLFWSSGERDTVAGTLIRAEALRQRLLGALPEPRTEDRILAVLDDQGTPLEKEGGEPSLDWRRPFVAREISPSLPYWEVGAYLTDPEMVASQAQMVRGGVWLLVATLLVAITAGGTLILRSLSAEMRLAGQKTTFVANVSHELKTPLTSIRLFAELLLQKRQPDEGRREEYLHIMVAEAERLSRLVDNVLTFSRQGSGQNSLRHDPLDLAALAAAVGDQLRPHLEHEGFVLVVDAPEPLPVRGDEEGLRQVLVNLLSNAEKYSGERREVELGAFRRGDQGVVEVRDRGLGVIPAHAERIFQEFFRSDDSLTTPRRGTGLGLPIARHVARGHGGDVTYAPRRGGGSVFSLEIPLDLPKGEEKYP
jgi:signal transduction histidine kinase